MDADVLAWLRRLGPGIQSSINAVLLPAKCGWHSREIPLRRRSVADRHGVRLSPSIVRSRKSITRREWRSLPIRTCREEPALMLSSAGAWQVPRHLALQFHASVHLMFRAVGGRADLWIGWKGERYRDRGLKRRLR
ncbi:MAG: BrnA antitoxin family protein [Alphaproteobacteria bacterium]|nr:BrnA antitoxin family protein [Alphaproteobacteria bacterium]